MIDLKTFIFIGALVGGIGAYLAVQKAKNPYLWFLAGFLGGFLGLACLLYFSQPKKRAVRKPPPARPVPAPPVSTKFWYYLDGQNQQLGPMSFEALHKASNEGKIFASTYVWSEDLENWKLWEEIRPRTEGA